MGFGDKIIDLFMSTKKERQPSNNELAVSEPKPEIEDFTKLIDRDSLHSLFPVSWEQYPTYVQSGENFIRVLAIADYPKRVYGNWLSELKRKKGVIDIVQYIDSASNNSMITYYKKTIQNKEALSLENSQSLRSVFFISDGTAITSETLGRSILSQFPNVPFETRVIPYVDTLERADEAVNQINLSHQRDGVKPLVFDTIVDPVIRERINAADAFNLDIYEGLISKIADEIMVQPAPHSGNAHGDVDSENYKSRIDAVHFALDNDDGARTTHYDAADIILVGVSRSGKTPTSLYLALQFGIRAANYPLTEDDLFENSLPKALQPYKDKLFGLVIDTDRLVKIRNERRAGSRYASYQQCQQELRAIQGIYISQGIPNIDVSTMSIEEIATRILQMTGLKRRIG